MSKAKIRGFVADIGNGTSEAGSFSKNERTEPKRIDTIITPGDLKEYLKSQKKGGVKMKASDLKEDELAIRWPKEEGGRFPGGREMFIASLARKENPAADGLRRVLTRYHDGTTRDIAWALTAPAVKKATGTNHIQGALVTCVPFKSMGDEMIQLIQECYLGEHHFLVNDEEFRYDIKAVEVYAEGAPAAHLLTGEEEGPYGLLDLGFYSLNAYKTIRQSDGTVTFDKSTGMAYGVGNIVDYVQLKIQQDYDTDVELTTPQRNALLQAYAQHTAYPQNIIINRRAVSPTQLAVWMEEGVQAVCTNIFKELAVAWKTDERGSVGGNFLGLSMVGGGAHYLKGALEQRFFPKKPETFSNEQEEKRYTIYVPTEPELYNYKTYEAFCKLLMNATFGSGFRVQ